ncbi:MAG: ABC transporter ATP-binding protein [Acidobacteriota bacterium]|jgi:subfamily B ATP-binding cassette protein MsbA
MTTTRTFLALLRPYRGRLVLAGLCMAGVAVFTVELAALIRPLFDRFLVPAAVAERRWHLPLLLLAYYLGKGLCGYLGTVLTARVGQEVVAELRGRVQAAILTWPLGRFPEAHGGDLLSRALMDVDRLETAVSEKVGAVVREGLVLIGLAGWLVYLDPWLALGSALAAPLVVGALVGFGRRVRRYSRDAQRELGRLAAAFQEAVSGIRVVKAFGMERGEARRFRDVTRDLVRANLRAVRVGALTPPLMELLGGIAAAGVFLHGSTRIADGRMTIGGFTSFLTTLLLMYTPVKKISNANNYLQHSLAAAERVFEVLEVEPEPLDRAGTAVRPLTAGIRFEDVWFRYDGEWVLRGVDLELPRGRIVALVGASGAGKTTLANLLLRFHEPARGRILWDGSDLRSASLRSLREQVGLVTQETILFHDTVAGNIAYGCAEASREVIELAARLANADGFIRSLPGGYDATVGERGERLSLGQRQRIAIARALVKHAPVLILDEATSSLDVESEAEVAAALERLMEGRTVLLIAHRLSTVRRAHQILVLERGRITEAGDHETLLRRQGAYARMHRRATGGGPVR